MPKPTPKTEPPSPALFFLIAGPCVLESEKSAFDLACQLNDICERHEIAFIFKASFDKANRSSSQSFRGPGLREGLKILSKIKKIIQRPILTDVHEISQVKPVAQVADILQIPAFLCRQTDLLQAAAETGRGVNVKKGPFLAPEDVDQVANKLRASGCDNYFITERGTTFGYHNLVVDMRNLTLMRQAGHRVIFDATHSVQRPGGRGTSSDGDGWLAPSLCRAAVAIGIDGLFLETHPTPTQALSDGPNMIPLSQLASLLPQLVRLHRAAHED